METIIRCNHCYVYMIEHEDHNVVECANCGEDDALMTDPT